MGKSKQEVDANGADHSTSTPKKTSDTGASQNKKPSTLADYKTIFRAAAFSESREKQSLAASSIVHTTAIFCHHLEPNLRNKKITAKLLQAVANGMESRVVNIDPQEEDLYAEDLLRRSPEFLLEKGNVTDWGGRTFKDISAFQYALWARDFKMIEMMLGCIPKTPKNDEIREEFRRQFEQVTSPRFEGGGLTYTHTYLRLNLDATGAPLKDSSGNWDCETVTVEHWENHFDLNPLIHAYQDYDTHFDNRTWPQRNACWVKGIGMFQRLLPVHLLQRYCDPDTPFYPLQPETFNGHFKRTMMFFNYLSNAEESLFTSSLSSDFSLVRGMATGGGGAETNAPAETDLAALRWIDEVSTNKIEKIKQDLMDPEPRSGMLAH